MCQPHTFCSIASGWEFELTCKCFQACKQACVLNKDGNTIFLALAFQNEQDWTIILSSLVRTPSPGSTPDNPKWWMVDVQLQRALSSPVSLESIKRLASGSSAAPGEMAVSLMIYLGENTVCFCRVHSQEYACGFLTACCQSRTNQSRHKCAACACVGVLASKLSK